MDPMYEQLMRRIEGNCKAVGRAGDIFMSMVSRSMLRQFRSDEGRQLDVSSLDKLFIRQGVFFRQITLTGEWWKHTTGRLLAFTVEDDIPIVLMPGFSSYTFINPNTGRREQVNPQLFKPEAFCLTQPLPAGKLTLGDLGRFAWKSLEKADLWAIFIACVSVVLLTMFTPYVTKMVFSEVVPSGSSSQLLPVAVLLFSAAFGLAMLHITRSLVVFRVKDKVEYTLQTALMTRLLHLPATFFRNWQAADLSSRVLSLSRFSGMLTENILTTVLSTIFSAILFIQFFIYGGPLLFIGIGVLAVVLFFNLLNYYYTRLVQERVNPNRSRMYGLLYEMLGGMQKIRVNGAEERCFQQWAERFADSEVNSASQPMMYFYSSGMSYASRLLPMIVTMWAAWKYELGLSDYIAYCAVLGIALSTINQLSVIMKQIGKVMPEARMCRPILEASMEDAHEQHVLTQVDGAIEVSGLRFRYSENASWIFNGLNLRIHQGEYVAIVGPSGCGKSTLLRLLLGFEKPQEGSIFYDHYNLREINMSSLRRNCVGVVMQDGRLIEGTLLDNILFTAPAATEADAWDVAKLVALDEDIKRMPYGMQTYITEDGRGISGGQRQRILLARALVQCPDIILLDEATSALDNVTQQRVSEYLASMKCTRITIAHRLETIRQCDRIIVLGNGRVIKEGTFDELMAAGAL
jgi:NHLM bacteriocin system ABC transporter ATP-binding protein